MGSSPPYLFQYSIMSCPDLTSNLHYITHIKKSPSEDIVRTVEGEWEYDDKRYYSISNQKLNTSCTWCNKMGVIYSKYPHLKKSFKKCPLCLDTKKVIHKNIIIFTDTIVYGPLYFAAK